MIANLAFIAAKEVGVKEIGRNGGTRVRQYQAATTLEPASWPWCSAFVCFCVREWLKDPKNVSWLNLKRSSPEQWRPKTALAFGLLSWARLHPNTVTTFPDTAKAQAGDIVVYDFSHTGIVESEKNGKLITIEGNTNSQGSREGDGVWRKERSKRLARAFLRIHPSALSV